MDSDNIEEFFIDFHTNIPKNIYYLECLLKKYHKDADCKLSYELESLDDVEVFFYDKITNCDLVEFSEYKLIELVASYVGELVRKLLGGYWVAQKNSNIPNFGLPVITGLRGLPESYVWCPLDVIKSCSNVKLKGQFSLIVQGLITPYSYIDVERIILDSQKLRVTFQKYMTNIHQNLLLLESVIKKYHCKDFRLDYNVDSLDEIELFLSEQLSEYSITEVTLEEMIEYISLYMGEVIIKKCNGKWILEENEEDFNYGYPIVQGLDGLPEDFGWCPIQVVFNFRRKKKIGLLKRATKSLFFLKNNIFHV